MPYTVIMTPGLSILASAAANGVGVAAGTKVTSFLKLFAASTSLRPRGVSKNFACTALASSHNMLSKSTIQ